MNDATLIKEKVAQAIGILDEYGIDCWITFVRESGMMRDPMMDFLCPADMTWHSAFIVTRSGETHAIVGQMEKQTVDELGVWGRVTGYVEGIKGELLGYLKALDPASIAVNYSTDQRGLRRPHPRHVPPPGGHARRDRIPGPARLGGEGHLQPEGPEDARGARAGCERPSATPWTSSAW